MFEGPVPKTMEEPRGSEDDFVKVDSIGITEESLKVRTNTSLDDIRASTSLVDITKTDGDGKMHSLSIIYKFVRENEVLLAFKLSLLE